MRWLLTITFVAIFAHAAFAMSEAEYTRFYETEFRPLAQRYHDCGHNHFTMLGRKSLKSFNSVEATVSKKCGKYIKTMRKKLSIAGLRDRKDQNDVINKMYLSIMEPRFRLTYETSQSMAQEERRNKQLRNSRLKEFEKILSSWSDCVFEFSANAAARSREGANTIARAALAVCEKHENRLFYHYYVEQPETDTGRDAAMELVLSNRAQLNDQILALVLNIRTARPAQPPVRKKEPEWGT